MKFLWSKKPIRLLVKPATFKCTLEVNNAISIMPVEATEKNVHLVGYIGNNSFDKIVPFGHVLTGKLSMDLLQPQPENWFNQPKG